jgi:nucleoside-diphosphate-sugar epimerase
MKAQTDAKDLLIIGGSGFLSGTLAKAAMKRGYHVWTITRGLRPIPEGVTNLIADRHETEIFKSAIEAEQKIWDLVIDCIAFEPADIQQDISLFGESAKHLIFVSTDFVYDPGKRQFPQVEDTEHYQLDGYGSQKRLCELELMKYAGEMPWTIVRPPHIYGPGSELGCLPTHSRDPNLIQRLKTGERLSLVGGGHFLQQPVLARDLAELLLDMGGKESIFNQVFNTPGPDVVESRTYYQIIADILGEDLKIEEVPVTEYLGNNPAASSFLCHRFYDKSRLEASGVPLPGTPIQVGLREQVESLGGI